MNYVPLKEVALLRRLTALLNLETPTSPPKMALWPGVLPVLALEGLLREPTIATATLDLTVATTTYVVGHTVPVGKRWKLVNVALGPEITTASPSAYSNGTTVIKLASIGSLSGLVVQPPDIWALQGWTIGAYGTNNVNNNAVPLVVHYLEEDVFGL